jgi:two-component system LytT family response regulator
MLRAIIIDDEQESIKALQLKLAECQTPVEVLATMTDSRGVIPLLDQYDIDVLFLDIEMPGLNGITLMENLQNRNFEVVLVTAYSEYALKALKASALDYLMKPVDMDELELALEKLVHKVEAKSQDRHLSSAKLDIEELLQQINSRPKKIALSCVSETYYVSLEEILYIGGSNNYSTFYLIDGKEIVVSKTLKEYESLLPPERFFRAHKSYLINLDHIKKLNKGPELTVSMINNVEIEISYRKKADFLKIMKG